MERRRGLDILNQILGGGRDEEYEKIITTTAEQSLQKIKALAGDNTYAKLYFEDMWTKIFDGIREKDIEICASSGLPQVLRIIADMIDMRDTLYEELQQRRKAEQSKGMN